MPIKQKAITDFFPSKLHDLLENAEKKGYSDVISWQDGGNSFKVWKPKVFAKTLMKKYFKQTKWKSFQRQLNIYGWIRIGTGQNRGGYYHPSFLQDIPELCLLMKRTPLKQNKKADVALPPSALEPVPLTHIQQTNPSIPAPPVKSQPFVSTQDVTQKYSIKDTSLDLFGGMWDIPNEAFELSGDSFCHTGPSAPPPAPAVDTSILPPPMPTAVPFEGSRDLSASSIALGIRESGKLSSEMLLFADTFDAKNAPPQAPVPVLSEPLPQVTIPDPVPMNKPRRTNPTPDFFYEGNGNLFSNEKDPAVQAMPETASAGETVFPHKLHYLLQQAETEGFQDIVSWVKGGTGFKVHNRKAFLEKIMPNYFDQSKFESFRRQLNLYGFQRMSNSGKDRGVYYHPMFLRYDPSLCERIERR